MSESNLILIEDDKDEASLKVPKLNLKGLSAPTNNNKNLPLIKTNGNVYLLESTITNSKKRESPKDNGNLTFKKFRDSNHNNDEINITSTTDVAYKFNMLLKANDESPMVSPNSSSSTINNNNNHVESKSNINNILLDDSNKNDETFDLPNNFVTKLNSSSPLPSPPLFNNNNNNNYNNNNNNNNNYQKQQNINNRQQHQQQQSQPIIVNEKKWNELLQEFSTVKNEKSQMEKEYKDQIDSLKQQLKNQQQQAALHQQQQHQQPIAQQLHITTPTNSKRSNGSLSGRASSSVGISDPIIIQDYLINEVKVLKSKLSDSQTQINESNAFIKQISLKLDDLKNSLLVDKLQTDSHFNSIEERLHNYALKFGEIDKFIYPYYCYPNTPKNSGPPLSPHVPLTPKDPNSPYYQQQQMVSSKPLPSQQPIPSQPSTNNNNNPNIIISAESNDKKNIQQKLHQRIQMQEQQKLQQQTQPQQSLNLIQQQQQNNNNNTTNQTKQPNSPKGMMVDGKFSTSTTSTSTTNPSLIPPNSPHSLNSQVPHYNTSDQMNNTYPQDSRYYYQYQPIQYYH